MKKRAKKFGIGILVLIIAGMAYGVFYIKTGIGIPCIFNKITGLKCPGCGVTHMCAALMKGDVSEAMRSNVVLFFISPLLLYILFGYMWRYIKTGRMWLPKWQTVALYIMIAALVIFAIVRNLIMIF